MPGTSLLRLRSIGQLPAPHPQAKGNEGHGHYLAVGFATGSCKSTFCHKMDCAVLKGEKCRNELRSRPSMEAVGMDAYRLATELGWEIYPIGSSCKSESVPHGTLMGLVLIR